MNFDLIIEQVIRETTLVSIRHFVPELLLCGTIVSMLILRIAITSRSSASIIAGFAFLGAGASLICAVFQLPGVGPAETIESQEFFTGLLVFDTFGVYFRVFLLLFLLLVLCLTFLSGIPDDEDGVDFYTLLFGATLGMMLMAAANHLLILFLGIEMASVPSYAMVGFLKGRKQSGEAALKYVVYGAGAAGVMLYGISILMGLLGTGDLSLMASRLEALVQGSANLSDATVLTLMLATIMVLVGIAFKLSLVPFHFWCPDAFEGASAEVAGFLSVASKGAAFALLVRFCLAFVGDSPETLSVIYLTLGIGLGIVAAVTATYGNLTAYTQSNIKRLLAYSTIAHAGYMLMAVSAMMVILSGNGQIEDVQEATTRCLEGLLFYLFVYLFMNLGAFAIVALIRNQIFSEEIEDYKGLALQTPALCVCMLVCMFSLIGIPPFGGFFAKLMIFASLFQAGAVHWSMWLLLAIGGLNTVFSLFYYLRVLKAMFLYDRPEGARTAQISKSAVAYSLVVSAPVLILGIWGYVMEALSQAANGAASVLFQ